MFINKLLITLLCSILFFTSKTDIKNPDAKTIAFKRAKGLDNGVSISWLEQTWNAGILDKGGINEADFKLLKQLGFKCIRLPVAFAHFENNNNLMQKVIKHVNEIFRLCRLYGFKLIICYHSGNLNDNNYLTETPKIAALWTTLGEMYKHQNADNLFFELYNEPPHMNPDVWKNAALSIVAAIRRVDKNRTLIVGASNYNSIYELSRTEPLADDNIIYTFHFYEPFLFTHQGAGWVGDQEATTGIPFPYDAANFPAMNPKAKGTAGEANYNKYNLDGNEQSVRDKLQMIKNWALKYNVPLLCGEYGVYNQFAGLDSRCRYIKAVRQTLAALNIPGILWDYNTNFSIFEGKPGMQHLPGCMKDAIGYTVKK